MKIYIKVDIEVFLDLCFQPDYHVVVVFLYSFSFLGDSMNGRISFLSIVALSYMGFCSATEQSTQAIEVVNNSDHAIRIAANSNEQMLHIAYEVPAHFHSLIVATLTKIQCPQDFLFAAIVNDSANEIRRAIQMGANINKEIDGKTPLLWAVLLKKYNAARCLMDLGAL